MLKRLALVALMALCAAPSEIRAVEGSRAHLFCDLQWASVPDEREACVSGQIEGARNVAALFSRIKQAPRDISTPALRVLEDCIADWAPDYASIDACARRRFGGL